MRGGGGTSVRRAGASACLHGGTFQKELFGFLLFNVLTWVQMSTGEDAVTSPAA
jgi:hypothetical protein